MKAEKRNQTRILVVDDNVNVREILTKVLEWEGLMVQSAEDGEKAWARLCEDRLFDLVITDLYMPVIDGLDLLEKIRQRSLQMEVILLTGAPTPEVITAARQLEAFAILVKPVEWEEFVQTIEAALTKRVSTGS